MRVTSNSFPNRLINQLGSLASRQSRLQNQAATGQRIQLPEDDPVAMRRVLDLQGEARAVDQFSSNIASLKDNTTASYSAMTTLKKVNDRAGEIATLADGLKSPQELTSYAGEINQLLEQAVQTANTTYRGDYLFAGSKVDKPPFTVVKDASGQITSVTYAGNTDAFSAEIGQNIQCEAQPIGANTTGAGERGLITDSRSGADYFQHLIDLRNHLQAGNTDAIASTDRVNIGKDEENILYHYGRIGALQSRLDAATSVGKDKSFALEQQVSGLVDADLAQTLVRLNQVQNAYSAALQTGGNIMSTSLLDYLK